MTLKNHVRRSGTGQPVLRRLALGWACAFAFALVLAGTASAQTAPKVSVGGVTVDRGTLSALVTVSDSAGRPVTGLRADSFTVQVDGQPVSGTSIDTSADSAMPLGMVLVMDISNTMSPTSISGSKDAFTQLIRSLRPSDEATLVTISTAVTQVVKPTSDQTALIVGVNGVVPRGRTALYAAVVQSVDYAKAAPQPQKVIVLVTEGGGRVGEEFGGASGLISRTMALNAAATGGAPLFVVGIGKEADVTFLQALADNSGGQYISASNGSEVSQLYTRLSDRLRLQYNLKVALPEGLATGSHTVTVTSNGGSGQGSFSTTVAVPTVPVAPVLLPAFSGIGTDLNVRTTARVTNAPTGSSPTILLDGQPVTSTAADKRAIDLDPAKLDPTKPHILRAQFDPADPSNMIETTFKVIALAPKITDPAGVIELHPGDLVKVTVQAQPGVIPTVRYVVDGKELEADSAAPYEFTLAKDGFADGAHTLSLVAESNGLKTSQTFDFAGPRAPGETSNAPKYLVFALVALALLAALGYGGWTFMGQARERRGTLVMADAPERLIKWADAHRVDRPRAETPPAVSPGPERVWGLLEIVSGAGAGTKFSLSGTRVLVGQGKFCTVKLNDKDVQETHFLVTPTGEIFASTPSCAMTLNGEETRSGMLTEGAMVGVGTTMLRFTVVANAESRQAS